MSFILCPLTIMEMISARWQLWKWFLSGSHELIEQKYISSCDRSRRHDIKYTYSLFDLYTYILQGDLAGSGAIIGYPQRR